MRCLLFSDVVTIEKTDENFRLLYNTKGRFVLHPLRHTQEAEVRTQPLPFTVLRMIRSLQRGQKQTAAGCGSGFWWRGGRAGPIAGTGGGLGGPPFAAMELLAPLGSTVQLGGRLCCCRRPERVC